MKEEKEEKEEKDMKNPTDMKRLILLLWLIFQLHYGHPFNILAIVNVLA